MTTLNFYAEKVNSFNKVLRLVDSFYMKFLVVFISLIMPVSLIENYIFDVEQASKIALFLFIIASTLLTLLWTRLDFKANPSLFSGYVPWGVKKNALIKRGILFFIMMKLFKDIGTPSLSTLGGFKFIFSSLFKVYLGIGGIVMLIACIIILFRPTKKRGF